MAPIFAATAFMEAEITFLIDIGLKTTSLLAITSLIAFAVHRRASASSRHLIWLTGLIGALLTPIFSLPLRTHQIAVPPTVAIASTIQHGQVTSTTLPHALLAPGAPYSATSTVVYQSAPSRNTGPNSLFVFWNFMPPQPLITFLWFFGFEMVAIALFGQIIALGKLPRRWLHVTVGSAVDRQAAAAFQDLAIDRTVEIRIASAQTHGKVPTPMTWGAWRPWIVLPADAESWPEERLRAALLHEAAHIRRWDYVTIVLLARIVVALYWYNPLVWYAARRLRIESELACDDLVLTAGHMSGPDYAHCLLDVARNARRNSAAAVSMAQTSRIEQRLRAILSVGMNRTAIGDASCGGRDSDGSHRADLRPLPCDSTRRPHGDHPARQRRDRTHVRRNRSSVENRPMVARRRIVPHRSATSNVTLPQADTAPKYTISDSGGCRNLPVRRSAPRNVGSGFHPRFRQQRVLLRQRCHPGLGQPERIPRQAPHHHSRLAGVY